MTGVYHRLLCSAREYLPQLLVDLLLLPLVGLLWMVLVGLLRLLLVSLLLRAAMGEELDPPFRLGLLLKARCFRCPCALLRCSYTNAMLRRSHGFEIVQGAPLLRSARTA